MLNKLDDYLYDIARVKYDVNLDLNESRRLIEKVVELAEYNHDSI